MARCLRCNFFLFWDGVRAAEIRDLVRPFVGMVAQWLRSTGSSRSRGCLQVGPKVVDGEPGGPLFKVQAEGWMAIRLA